MTPMPIMVDTTGTRYFSTKSRSSSLAPLSSTPPPTQMMGRFARSSSLITFLICTAWPFTVGL